MRQSKSDNNNNYGFYSHSSSGGSNYEVSVNPSAYSSICKGKIVVADNNNSIRIQGVTACANSSK